MIVGTLELEILLPGAGSLKEKRAVLNRLKDRVRTRFNASVGEIGHQESWQRARIGIALVVTPDSGARDLLAAVQRSIEQDDRLLVVDSVLEVR